MFIDLLDLADLCLMILTMSELFLLHLHSHLATEVKPILNECKGE